MMKLATLVRETNFQHCQRAYRTLCGMPLDTYATVADYPDADYCLDARRGFPSGRSAVRSTLTGRPINEPLVP